MTLALPRLALAGLALAGLALAGLAFGLALPDMAFPDLATRLGLLTAAALIEAAFGYPDWLYRRIGHPVTWIGALIERLDRALNADRSQPTAAPHPVPLPGGKGTMEAMAETLASPLPVGEAQGEGSHRDVTLMRKLPGILALGILLVVSLKAAALLQFMLVGSWPGLALLAIGASTLLATRSLATHVTAVADALDDGGLPAGRRAVAQIVGRDPEALDEVGVSRAAIESLAENFSDGVVAPALWFVIGGLPGIVAYKAINTADSMIGHRNPRYEAFGWASARLDDAVNLPASRLAALLIALPANVVGNGATLRALRTVWRDAGKHRSPNAGWPEAAMAGALGLQLAGPRRYGGVLTRDAPMGDGRADAGAADIGRALAVFRLAAGLGLAVAVSVWLGLLWHGAATTQA